MYEPLSRVCLPVDVTYPSFALLALPLIFDVAIITLTAFKIFRLASGWRKLSGAEIVRNLPSIILFARLRAVMVALHRIPGWDSVRTDMKERALYH